MNLTSREILQLQNCEKQGFVDIQWQEGISELTGIYSNSAHLRGKKIVVSIFINHIVLNPETKRTKYQISLSFSHKSEIGDILYLTYEHTELELEDALLYAQWQATLIFRLIES